MRKSILTRSALLLASMLTATYSYAHDFEVDGIYYNVLKDKTNEVEVTFKGTDYLPSYQSPSYSGDVIIPEIVVYNGASYRVSSVGSRSFQFCKDLYTVSIPKTIESIGDYCFSGCNSLVSLLVDNDNKVFDSRDSCNAIIESKSNKLVYGGCNTIIPNSVVSIGNFAFDDLNITQIVIPNSISSIGMWAFTNCKFTTLEIPNSVKEIGEGAFGGCSELISVVLPDSLSIIEPHTFDHCLSLTDISLPESITTIEYSAFANCKSLSEIELPKFLKRIGNEAFQESGLKNIVVPDFVTTIGQSAFFYCESLESVVLPNSLLEIGYYIVGLCPKLKTVISKIRNPFDISSSVFDGIISDSELIVPFGSLYKYKVCDGWDKFSKITEAAPVEYELTISNSGGGIVVYDGNEISQGEKAFAIQEQASVVFFFKADTGYKLKTVKLNGKEITELIDNGKLTISNINEDCLLEAEFEPIYYSLTIDVSENGVVSYDNVDLRHQVNTFSVAEGLSVSITFAPDEGYQIASVKINDKDVSNQVSNNQLTINIISSDTKVEVTFEAIPPTTYSLSIQSIGNGSVVYNNTSIRSKESTFDVVEGSSATLSFTADTNCRLKSVKVGE